MRMHEHFVAINIQGSFSQFNEHCQSLSGCVISAPLRLVIQCPSVTAAG